MEGRRVRRRDGAAGTITAAAGLIGRDGAVFQYAVQIQWLHADKITYTKGDFENGAFELLP
jgi:hypothetical protein